MIANADVFLLVMVRIFAMLSVAPLLNSRAIPGIARVGLALFAATAVYPWVLEAGYPIPEKGLFFIFLMIGEVLIGVFIGFFLRVIYAAFLLAGQYFTFQMGFGASQVFDPMAQMQIPLLGQFLNLVAMLVFLITGGFQKLFLGGIMRSFQVMRAADVALQTENMATMMIRGLTQLFEQALVISFPILGTLLIISVSLGLLAKAAPQMNLLMLGFPVKIGIAFMVIMLTMPLLIENFERVIDGSFRQIMEFLRAVEDGRTL
jgi:flagellar biosynthetic protein FliR